MLRRQTATSAAAGTALHACCPQGDLELPSTAVIPVGPLHRPMLQFPRQPWDPGAGANADVTPGSGTNQGPAGPERVTSHTRPGSANTGSARASTCPGGAGEDSLRLQSNTLNANNVT